MPKHNADDETGTVNTINRSRGFGFIRGADGQQYFFHRSAVADSFDGITEGEAVRFTPTNTAKGLRAENVSRGR